MVTFEVYREICTSLRYSSASRMAAGSPGGKTPTVGWQMPSMAAHCEAVSASQIPSRHSFSGPPRHTPPRRVSADHPATVVSPFLNASSAMPIWYSAAEACGRGTPPLPVPGVASRLVPGEPEDGGAPADGALSEEVNGHVLEEGRELAVRLSLGDSDPLHLVRSILHPGFPAVGEGPELASIR